MPIYEYRCERCGDFEESQRITDPPLERCPKCRRKVRRLISNTSFQLKGSGWYVTDYARGSSNGGKKETAADSGSSSDAAADTKADGKKKSDKAAPKAESKAAPASDT